MPRRLARPAGSSLTVAGGPLRRVSALLPAHTMPRARPLVLVPFRIPSHHHHELSSLLFASPGTRCYPHNFLVFSPPVRPSRPVPRSRTITCIITPLPAVTPPHTPRPFLLFTGLRTSFTPGGGARTLASFVFGCRTRQSRISRPEIYTFASSHGRVAPAKACISAPRCWLSLSPYLPAATPTRARARVPQRRRTPRSAYLLHTQYTDLITTLPLSSRNPIANT